MIMPKKPKKTGKKKIKTDKKEASKITKNMTIGEVVSKHPQTAEIMLSFGLHCVGCHVAFWETIEQGAKGHGLPDKKIDEMVAKMNEAAAKN